MYLLDTNIFITAKNATPMDIWVTFWDRFTELLKSGQLFTIQLVKDELGKGNDALKEWVVKRMPEKCIIDLDEETILQFQSVIEWANAEARFTDSAREEFARVADSYLVATAAAKNMVLVTHEMPSPNSRKRILIPDACEAMGVEYCDLNEVLRGLKVTI